MIYITNKNMDLKNGKIDLVGFIPKKTTYGFDVFIHKFYRNRKQWLKIWYKQPRLKPIEIKRFICPKIFGSLLGQMQAEGTKYTNIKRKTRLEFSNKLIEEHKDFVHHLQELGIKKNNMIFHLIDCENRDYKILDMFARKFEKSIGIRPTIYYHFSNHGGYGFKTIIRSTLLNEIILYSMDKVRKNKITYSKKFNSLRESFFAKLLTGDGTLRIDKRKGSGGIKIAIKDKSIEYLKDYNKIMKILGFNYVKIYEKYHMIEASCSFDNLLYLYRINAFKNTNNWNKLLISIGLCLKGCRLKTKLRFLDLENLTFTSSDIVKKYNLHPNNRKWLSNMQKEGYVKCIHKKPPYKYQLTEKSKKLILILKEWKNDLNRLAKLKKITDLSQLLESLKKRPDLSK